jgi:hypothetical protein
MNATQNPGTHILVRQHNADGPAAERLNHHSPSASTPMHNSSHSCAPSSHEYGHTDQQSSCHIPPNPPVETGEQDQ